MTLSISSKSKNLKTLPFHLETLLVYRAAEPTFKEGRGRGANEEKRAVSNLLTLASPGETTTACPREKFLKIRVPRLTKIGFLTHFFVICCPTRPTFLYEYSQNNCFEMHHQCIYAKIVSDHP